MKAVIIMDHLAADIQTFKLPQGTHANPDGMIGAVNKRDIAYG